MPPAVLIGAAAIAAAAPIVAGAIANSESAGDRAKAQQAGQEALDAIKAIHAPPDIAKAIILQKFQSAGLLTPKLEENINLGFSKVGQIQEDPSLKAAQINALQQLQQRGQTGLGPEDQAALAKIRSNILSEEKGKTGAIMQQMQSRGLGGSGAELAALLSNAQAGTQRESDADIEQAGVASQRALQALIASGQLGGQVRAQDFDINKARAEAQDAVARFNVQNQAANQMRNINAQNQAQQYNLNSAQQISNMNVNAANQELARQQQAQQQMWQDQMARAQAIANAQTARANILSGQAAQTAQGYQNIGSGVAAGAGAAANFMGRQNNQQVRPVQTQLQPIGQLPAPSSSVTVKPATFETDEGEQLPASNWYDNYQS